MRTWRAGQQVIVSGIPFRVREGRKAPGDLRLEWLTPDEGWKPVEMAATGLMTHFFVENEEHLRQFRPHWQQTGRDYFIAFLNDVLDRGWAAAVATLKEQQAALGQPTADDSFDRLVW